MHVKWDNSDDSDDEGSDNDSNNFIVVTAPIVSTNYSCESVSKNPCIVEEA